MECQRCPFFPFVKGISQFKIPDAFDKFKDRKYKELGIKLRDVLGEACCYCSMHSNDDNPSNHGQSFVSLDDTENVGGEYNDAKQDYIISNAKEGFSESSLTDNPYEALAEKDDLEHLKRTNPNEYERRIAKAKEVGYTNLPASVEQVLKRELMSFASLEIQDMMLLCCCMKGITISEFATMRWFPRGMLFKNSQTLKPVTKQASHARFMNVIRKFPQFKSVARYLRPDGVDKGGGFRGKKKSDAPQQANSTNKPSHTVRTTTSQRPAPKAAGPSDGKQKTNSHSKHSRQHRSASPAIKKRTSKKEFPIQGDFFLN